MNFRNILRVYQCLNKRLLYHCECGEYHRKYARLAFKRAYSSVIGNTTILIQDGLDIQELPLAVKKLSARDAAGLLLSERINTLSLRRKEKNNNNYCSKNVAPLDDYETSEIIKGFQCCHSIDEMLKLLETVPASYVTSYVALHILRKMAEIEVAKLRYPDSIFLAAKDSDNFAKTAIFKQLINLIFISDSLRVLLDFLKLIHNDETFKVYLDEYKSKVYDEILLRIVDGKCDTLEVCCAVKEFYSVGLYSDIDKLWIGITDNEKGVDTREVVEIFSVLPYLKKSRRIIVNFLQKKLPTTWYRLKGKDVAEIVTIMIENKINSPQILQILGRWFNTNIHAISEEELLVIVDGFQALEFHNTEIERGLERYMKTKCCKIQNQRLVASVMSYCEKFRIYSNNIFEPASDYIVTQNESLSPRTLKTVFTPFGIMRYHPKDSHSFWKCVESLIESKFLQFHPQDIIDMMLTCVFMGKYPINFANDIFNPYFMERLQINNKENWPLIKAKLNLIDIAMTLNCKMYKGPMLPKDTSARAWTDSRIRKVLHHMNRGLLTFVDLCVDRVKYSFVPPPLPMTDYTVIDALLAPERTNFSYRKRDRGTAILIHSPEHYCSNVDKLIGPQAMRESLFSTLGFNVVSLKYLDVAKLCGDNKSIRKYLENKIKNAGP